MLLTLTSSEPHINSCSRFPPFYQQQYFPHEQNPWCQDLQRFNLSCFQHHPQTTALTRYCSTHRPNFVPMLCQNDLLPWRRVLSKLLYLLQSHIKIISRFLMLYKLPLLYQTSSHLGAYRALWTATLEEQRQRNTQISFSSIWIYGWKLNYQLYNDLLLCSKTHKI